MAITVKLRQKPAKGNRLAFYLDFYPAIIHPETGKQTRRVFLGLFTHDKVLHEEQHYTDDNGKPQFRIIQALDKNLKPKKVVLSPTQKKDNELSEKQAEILRRQWDEKVNQSDDDLKEHERKQIAKERGNQNFLEYFKQMAAKRTGSSRTLWDACYNYLVNYAGEVVKFSDLNEHFCEEFREYLLKTKSIRHKKTALSQNSAVAYFSKFKAALNKGYKQGFIKTNLNISIESIKLTEVARTYLTQEELNQLAKTDCQNSTLKRAALFSALTGLRHSDIKNLVWGDVEHVKGEGYVIHFKQQKTSGVEDLPISDQAFSLLGKRGKPSEQIFDGLIYSAHYNRHLFQWIGAAGITKQITFHCFRHTFAVLQLSNGTDIYTVSKMLGHRDLKTTQHYAKILDSTKRKAANAVTIEM